MRLASACAICNSMRWCGRPCKSAPIALAHELAAGTVTADVVNKADPLINSNAAHQAKWRTANLETNRQRARDGMRKRRAELKDNG